MLLLILRLSENCVGWYKINDKECCCIESAYCILIPDCDNETTWLLLKKFKLEVLVHPLHSLGLVPSDYHLFSGLKEHLSWKIFNDDDEMHHHQTNTSRVMATMLNNIIKHML